MRTVFITGTSSGLGKSLAELFLKKGDLVFGIGRNHVVDHANYTAMHLNLAEQEAVNQFFFPAVTTEEIVLINNAGIIGDINRFSQQTTSDFDAVLQVNLNALVALTHKFLQQFQTQNLSVVNISSGAAKRPIASWLAYCTAKAGVDMFSQVLFEEEKERGKSTRVYALSPGVIDTKMQSKIRESKREDFSAAQNFHDFYTSGQLNAPDFVASKLDQLLTLPHNGKVLWNLSDIEEGMLNN